jgi:hypothetical protein
LPRTTAGRSGAVAQRAYPFLPGAVRAAEDLAVLLDAVTCELSNVWVSPIMVIWNVLS